MSTMIPAPHAQPQLPSGKLDTAQPVYFIGIGGIGMSGLAQMLLEKGFTVMGSDPSQSPRIEALQAAGATIVHDQADTDHLPEEALVVVSTAIKASNPQLQLAKSRGQSVWHRSDLLRDILEGPAFGYTTTIGATGTHGKTTITGMTGMALTQAGRHPTIIAGGLLPGVGSNAVMGAPQGIAVAELDESDGTVAKYNPTITLIANLELDHADHFGGGYADIHDTFLGTLNRLTPKAREPIPKTVLFNGRCPNTLALVQAVENPNIQWVAIYPLSVPLETLPPLKAVMDLSETQVDATTGGYTGTITWNGQPVGTLSLQVPGEHNAFNALAAFGAGYCLGADPEGLLAGLAKFTGMGRRFEPVGTLNGALLVDDYAHHPTEIRATLRAATQRLGRNNDLFVIMQPHRYTRLQALWDEFVYAFTPADKVWITDVYPAGEEPIEGINAKTLATRIVGEGVVRPDNVRYLPKADWPGVEAELAALVKPGDIVITMGAGDVTRLLRGMGP